MGTAEIFREFSAYLPTDDFRKGLYVEIGGLAIDLLLLSILIPTIIWLANLRKSHHAKLMANFYTLQLHHKVAELLLKIGGVSDISNELNTALKDKKIDSIFSHSFYGNTENLLQLLNIRIENRQHISGHRLLESSQIERLISEADGILADLDRYIFLFNSVGIVNYSKKLFEARMILCPLRDYIDDLSKTDKELRDFDSDFYPLLQMCFKYFYGWFLAEKELPDKIFRWKYRLQMVGMFVSIPYVLVYRLLMPIICRISKRTYLDAFGSNFFTLMINPILANCPLTDAVIEKGMGVSNRELMAYKQGIKRPSEADQERILRFFMGCIPPESWNKLVLAVLEEDVKRQRPNLVTVEAVKANAVHKFCIYVQQIETEDKELMKFFLRLFQLKPF